jgi:hypothetical protein
VVFIHNGILGSHEEEEMLSFPGKWMELENIMLSEVSVAQRPKIVCSPSNVNIRSRANATRGLDLITR